MRAARPKKIAKPKKTSFVPRSLFMGVLATTTVVPLCACGGSVEGSHGAMDAGIQFDGRPPIDVARSAFEGGGFVATDAFAGVAADAFVGVAVDAFVGVAADAFAGVALDAFAGVAADAFGVADVAFHQDGLATVAACCFDASTGDASK